MYSWCAAAANEVTVLAHAYDTACTGWTLPWLTHTQAPSHKLMLVCVGINMAQDILALCNRVVFKMIHWYQLKLCKSA